MTLLTVVGLVKTFGGLRATDDLSMSVEAGEVHALIGPNGAGKTTLLAQLSGSIIPDEGTIVFDGANITTEHPHARALRGLGRSHQITSVFLELTVLQNVSLAIQATQGHSFRFWRQVARDASLLRPARELIDRVMLTPHADTPAGRLAHGTRRQLEIAMALAARPKLLLLDEPMAGMSKQDSANMTRLLEELGRECTLLLVEHDMDAVFALSDRITVLDSGRIIASGTPEAIRTNAVVRDAYLGGEEEFL